MATAPLKVRQLVRQQTSYERRQLQAAKNRANSDTLLDARRDGNRRRSMSVHVGDRGPAQHAQPVWRWDG